MAELAAGRLDVLAGPIQATPERSSELLFTEGLCLVQYQFGTRQGLTITKPADLRGKRLAVQLGTEYAEWAERNAPKYGFAVEKLATLAQVLAAVRSGCRRCVPVRQPRPDGRGARSGLAAGEPGFARNPRAGFCRGGR